MYTNLGCKITKFFSIMQMFFCLKCVFVDFLIIQDFFISVNSKGFCELHIIYIRSLANFIFNKQSNPNHLLLAIYYKYRINIL